MFYFRELKIDSENGPVVISGEAYYNSDDGLVIEFDSARYENNREIPIDVDLYEILSEDEVVFTEMIEAMETDEEQCFESCGRETMEEYYGSL